MINIQKQYRSEFSTNGNVILHNKSVWDKRKLFELYGYLVSILKNDRWNLIAYVYLQLNGYFHNLMLFTVVYKQHCYLLIRSKKLYNYNSYAIEPFFTMA